MNDILLEALLRYINAAIDEKMDDMQSSDGGLTSSLARMEAEEILRTLASR